MRLRSAALVLALAAPLAAQGRTLPIGPGGTLVVVQTIPAAVTVAPVTTSITVAFDRPLAQNTVDARSFRVFGRQSGPARGHYSFVQGGATVVFTPADPFLAGEVVYVDLAHSIRGLDGSRLRAAGHAFQFGTAVVPSGASFVQYDVLSNTTGPQTRIYGASATDLNHDGYPDLTTVNEVSADLRVFLNLADGTGNYGGFLVPVPIGDEASPNEPADFDNDGNADLCTAATFSEDVWIALGNGDGSYDPPQSIAVGQEPHGIAVLDVEGDGDLDIVNCNRADSNLSRMLNDGAGVFGAPSFFDGGVNGEYGLAAGDMDVDGITDLVVAGQTGQHLRTLLGLGGGTFTPAGPAQPSGGLTWVVVVADVDGDGDLDASTANSTSGTAGILKNTGTGTFGPVTTVSLGAHTVGTDLGDLDGDGDLDWVVSSFGGQFWRLYRNDGTGTFAFWTQIAAPAYPSCAILLDTDRDGDLDLALTDEIADAVVLMENL